MEMNTVPIARDIKCSKCGKVIKRQRMDPKTGGFNRIDCPKCGGPMGLLRTYSIPY